MAKNKKPPKLWLARDKDLEDGRDDEPNYVLLVGERTNAYMMKKFALWATKGYQQPLSLCATEFERAYPHLKLEPGKIRQLAPPQWAEKRKAK